MSVRAADPEIARIIAALTEILYLPADSITAGTRFADLGLDSLDLVEAMLELEVTLGRDLDHDMAGACTVGELAAGCIGVRPNAAPATMRSRAA